MARLPPIALLAAVVLMVILVIVQVGIISDVVEDLLNGNISTVAGSNAATSYLLIYSALADVVAAATFMIAVIHYFSRDAATRAVTGAFSLLSLVIFCLAFGFGAKQESIGHTGGRQDAVFALTVILTFVTLIVSAIAWLMHEWGPGGYATTPSTMKGAGAPGVAQPGYGGVAQPGYGEGVQQSVV